jgi:hypothetical protein
MDQAEKKEIFKIPLESLFSDFQEHIRLENNNRIIFSGKFGIGKTTFLLDFFKKHSDKYEVFHLFPVNYQIASNENIVDFLKYDILLELLKKNREIFKDNKAKGIRENIFLVFNFLKQRGLKKNLRSTINSSENIVDIAGGVFGVSVSNLGKSLKDLLDFDEEWQAFKKESGKGDKGLIEDCIQEIKENKNNTESDILSEILKRKIAERKGSKESFLILDDLERIDPEHIFRIFNVFSAHLCLDNPTNELTVNKFGFDKIIIVADINNLRSIFRHKYGEKTDHKGYFNKFYSNEIFEFKNETIIKGVINEIISSYIVSDKKMESVASGDGMIRVILELFIERAIYLEGSNKLDLRELLKGIRIPIIALSNKNYKKRIQISRWDPCFFEAIDALGTIFGGLRFNFVDVIKDLRVNIDSDDLHGDFLKEWSYLLLCDMGNIKESGSLVYDGKYNINVTPDNFSNRNITSVNWHSSIDLEERINKSPLKELFFDLLIDWINRKK